MTNVKNVIVSFLSSFSGDRFRSLLITLSDRLLKLN